jgi:hypothetical protein
VSIDMPSLILGIVLGLVLAAGVILAVDKL